MPRKAKLMLSLVFLLTHPMTALAGAMQFVGTDHKGKPCSISYAMLDPGTLRIESIESSNLDDREREIQYLEVSHPEAKVSVIHTELGGLERIFTQGTRLSREARERIASCVGEKATSEEYSVTIPGSCFADWALLAKPREGVFTLILSKSDPEGIPVGFSYRRGDYFGMFKGGSCIFQ